MTGATVIILEGSHGHSFFFREVLLEQGLAKRVDLASQAEQAIGFMQGSEPYDLVIINLVESWEEGMQFGFWLNQHSVSCPVMLIAPPEMTASLFLTNTPFSVISAPLSLRDFTESARRMLSSNQVRFSVAQKIR